MPETAAQPRAKRGPKPKTVDAIRAHLIACRLTTPELAQLDAGRPAGVTRGARLRALALARQVPASIPTLNLKTVAQLAKLSANINQVAKRANAGLELTGVTQLITELSDLLIHSVAKIKADQAEDGEDS